MFIMVQSVAGKIVGTKKIAYTFPKCPLMLKKLDMIMKEVPIKFSIDDIEIKNKVPIEFSTLPNRPCWAQILVVMMWGTMIIHYDKQILSLKCIFPQQDYNLYYTE